MSGLDSVASQFLAQGIEPPERYQFNAGKFIRYGGRNKKAFYKIWENRARNGKLYYSGVFGCGGNGPHKLEPTWDEDVTPDERAEMRAKWAADAEAAEAKRIAKGQAAARRAEIQWEHADKISGITHPYLVAKQIKKAESARIWHDRSGVEHVVIPFLRLAEKSLAGLQKIDPTGLKRFNTGFDKNGSACRLGRATNGAPVLLCEGYATGASIRAALDYTYPVFVGADAHNLIHVARVLRTILPQSPILICADDDWVTGNAGEIAAKAVAAEVPNVFVVLPVFPADKKREPKWSDFNDVHVQYGLEVAANVLRPAVLALPASNADAPAMPTEQAIDDVEAASDNRSLPATIDALLAHCAIIYGTSDVWDSLNQKRMKFGGFTATFGKPLATEWRDHEHRRTIHPDALPRRPRGRSLGEGGGEKVADMLDRYTLLYGTKSVWDSQVRRIIELDAVRAAVGNDVVRFWQESPLRKMIDYKNLVFDPPQKCDLSTHINMFTGIAMVPDPDVSKCEPIVELAMHLCSDNLEHFNFLMCWIALPLQRLGTKLDSAVLMFGHKHGTGKSLFWNDCVLRIYGREWNVTATQQELESSFTSWRQNKLMVLFEEVLSRSEKFNHLGLIKHMITGETQQINAKFVDTREDSSYLNCVFLSNELQPIPLELEDRRFFVTKPPELPPGLLKRVSDCIDNGGVESFYYFLLNYALGDFNKYTKPPMTEAKRRVIEYGLPFWQVFHARWKAGELSYPYCSCRTVDLYTAYKRAAEKAGERALTDQKFSTLLAHHETKDRAWIWLNGGRIQQTIFVIGYNEDPEIPHERWLGNDVDKFHDSIRNKDD